MRKVITEQSIGSIHLREDGKVHLYLMDNPKEDITLEIVLSKNATHGFLKEALLVALRCGFATMDEPK